MQSLLAQVEASEHEVPRGFERDGIPAAPVPAAWELATEPAAELPATTELPPPTKLPASDPLAPPAPLAVAITPLAPADTGAEVLPPAPETAPPWPASLEVVTAADESARDALRPASSASFVASEVAVRLEPVDRHSPLIVQTASAPQSRSDEQPLDAGGAGGNAVQATTEATPRVMQSTAPSARTSSA